MQREKVGAGGREEQKIIGKIHFWSQSVVGPSMDGGKEASPPQLAEEEGPPSARTGRADPNLVFRPPPRICPRAEEELAVVERRRQQHVFRGTRKSEGCQEKTRWRKRASIRQRVM